MTFIKETCPGARNICLDFGVDINDIANVNKMQSETADLAPGAATLANSTKQRCVTFDWCRHLANWSKSILSVV